MYQMIFALQQTVFISKSARDSVKGLGGLLLMVVQSVSLSGKFYLFNSITVGFMNELFLRYFSVLTVISLKSHRGLIKNGLFCLATSVQVAHCKIFSN